MKPRTIFLAAGLLIISATFLSAQRGQRPRPGNRQSRMEPIGEITGTVVDQASQTPLEYANISLFRARDSVLVTGSTTDAAGQFILQELLPGRYILEAKFIGYFSHSIDTLMILPRRPTANVGTIGLRPAVIQSEGIEVVEERPLVTYKLDKKIVDVSGQLTAVAGSAVDALENVPSITVDIDGNVELRGSTSFTVLIDGRPTVLDANDVLQQTPASIISTIEIMTNPSAKYDPDGVAGIINIITKKSILQGVSGLINSHGGLYENYGGDFLVSYRTNKWNAALGANLNQRNFPGTLRSENITTFNGTTTSLISAGTNLFQMQRYNLQGELSADLTKKDIVTLSFRLGEMNFARGSDVSFEESIEPGSLLDQYLSANQTDRGGVFLAINGEVSHKFAQPLHELKARLYFSSRGGDETNISELFTLDNIITEGQKVIEEGPALQFRTQLEYTLPLTESSRFEAGYQGRVGTSEDETGVLYYDPQLGVYLDQPEFGNTINYRRDIHALFAQYANESRSLSYQVGLRGEYTYRKIDTPALQEAFTIDRWDVFPSLHTSYSISERVQLLASYSLRIRRPRGWFLEPFLTWENAYNVRIGNPALEPSYINSYELGLQLPLGRNVLSLETYLRQVENVVERIRSVYDTNVMLTKPENIGTSRSVGLEAMLNLRQIRWWTINIIGTVYSFQLDGALDGRDFSRSSENWNLRLNNTFRFGENTRIQLVARMTSPSVSAQGRREGMQTVSLAIRQSLLDKRLNATLQLGDIFRTAKREMTTQGPGFDYYSLSTRRSPTAVLTLTYNFNSFKERRNPGDREGDFEEDF